ncbi:cytidylyltransferase domain-containing protein [Nitratidesulfovibrio sp. 1201_IL3209]|uniref:cytidylyltransferase domain-containing protein n=1 Tax=Nitratidesulfovibrio sp. 1201_IL3209 TaxID=3084053 RepID=UPI002FDA380D
MSAPHPLSPPPPDLPGCRAILPDPAVMPSELCVLAVTESWLGRTEAAVRRVLDHGLPSSALYDWIMDCGRVRHQRLSDPARRDVRMPRADWDVVAVIPARGGSRGVPRKALRTVGGIPLVARAIGACRSVGSITRVMVNTDCPDIAAAARAAGADVPFLRPAELATDDASPLDAWVFAQVWMLLVERRVPDFLLSVSATHPCLLPDEMRRAVDRLAAANRPSLQTVARLPAVSREFLTPDFHPLGGRQATAEGDGPEHDRPDGERFLQCGAFSITCNRPYYHVQPWFRQYMADVPAPPAEPMAHVLSARQGVDIDEPWDLATCRLLLDGDDPFPACTPADVAAHRIAHPAAGDDEADARTRASAAPITIGMGNMAEPANLACVVVLPPEVQGAPDGPDGPERTGEPDGPYLHIAGTPTPCRVLDAVLAALPEAPLALCGEGAMARAVARRYGLPLLPLPEFLADRRAAWPVPLLGQNDIATRNAAAAWPGTPGPVVHLLLAGRDILCIDGRAALLDAATLRDFVTAALAPATAECGLPVCSVSPAPVHPAHLKRVDGAGSVISVPDVPARRQDLPEVWCRDGALTLLRARPAIRDGAPGAPCPDSSGPCNSGPGESTGLAYHPIPIGRAQATLTASRLDAARGVALAAHDGHPDIPAAAPGAPGPHGPHGPHGHQPDPTEPA